ncbi:MAG: hypothetical protein J6A26_07190 [Oscillospiraceae bacterium]|nr:hypothetical protein [Oscillospiraceae bacterium]
MKHLRDGLLIPLGGCAYGLVEVVFRGYTHWTMLLLGGLCFWLMAQIATLSPRPVWLTAAPCALLITGLEFLTGCVVNLLLGWNVWNYSNQPFNLLGQICLSFLGIWYLLSIPALPLAKHLKQRLAH